jgi:hypothetical protein
MSDIFISYASSESSRAKQLANVLVEQGWTVWWDSQIKVGESWANQIEQALDGARCVIVLWSANSASSAWVLDEAAYARELGKLIPVQLDKARIPFGFERLQTIALIDWDGQSNHPGMKNLLRAISTFLAQHR